jgi:hypothetical protein
VQLRSSAVFYLNFCQKFPRFALAGMFFRMLNAKSERTYNVRCVKAVTMPAVTEILIYISLKGLSHKIFWACFLGCMDVSRPECEPLVALKF